MKRLRLTLLLASCVAAAAVAQSPLSGGTLIGVVTDASNGLPIAGAEVALPLLKKTATTNDKGEFRLGELVPGPQELRVRRIGFLEFTASVTISSAGPVERKVVLRRVQTLNPVEVSADPVMASFEENRRIGLGRFLTRAQLESQEHLKLAEILEQVGARTKRSGPHAWVRGSRGPKTLRPKRVSLEGRGTDVECYAQVFLNDALLFNGEEGMLVPDVNAILPQSLEAIEYYSSAAQTPMRYSRLNSQCGVLVLHTRRTVGSTEKAKP